MFDLFSIVHSDTRIRKPWRISTTSYYIHGHFDEHLCDGSHPHVPCAGRDTKATECYTISMVKSLHTAWDKHALRIRRNNMPVINCVIPLAKSHYDCSTLKANSDVLLIVCRIQGPGPSRQVAGVERQSFSASSIQEAQGLQ